MARQRPAPSTARLRYQGLSAETRRLLAAGGESGRFEFKQTADAVGSAVLVAAANAAALEGIDYVTILVGVAEKQDASTGLVTGEVIGLDNLERDRGKITDRGSATRPVPVQLTLVEENIRTSKPILRLVVGPTRPPHYTDGGQRVTRANASTRAITDEELVAMYLQREAEAFEARFRRTAAAISGDLEQIGDEVQNIGAGVDAVKRAVERAGERLDDIHELADQAAGISDESREFIFGLDETIGHIQASLNELHQAPSTFEEAWWDLFRARNMTWMMFRARLDLVDAELPEVEAVLKEIMAERTTPFDYERNLREAEVWYALLTVVEKQSDPIEESHVAELLAAAEKIRAAKDPLPPPDLERKLDLLRRKRVDPL